MTSKKWLVMFVSTVLMIVILLAGFNILTDPFGVFGDLLFDWTSYNATNNPRTAKITYLDRHHEEYDSYILGCSSTSSFPVDALNTVFGADFYNLITYGADMYDCEKMAEYIIENYTVKNIVLNVYLDNGVHYDVESNGYTHAMLPRVVGSGVTDTAEFYSRFLFANPSYGIAKIDSYLNDKYLAESFDVFDEKTGAYDKKKRDAEPIGSLEEYYKAYPAFANYPAGSGYLLPEIEECMASVSRIKKLCEDSGVNLTVVTAPVYWEYLDNFAMDDVIHFYKSLAEVTDYWDFSYSSVSFEPRYFYDETHFRNAVGYMVAARIAGDELKPTLLSQTILEENGIDSGALQYIPEDFGYYVTADNADAYFETYSDTSPLNVDDISAEVPILMYHHIAEGETNFVTVTPEEFDDQMRTLCDNGYTAISLAELYSYVMHGTELPENPIVITFDDGYLSNYEYAYPILEKYGMCGTIFTIGYAVGADTYKDTDVQIIPHFGEAEAREMAQSGVIDIQSHTYEMHENPDYETDEVRENMARLDGESMDNYIDALRYDISISMASLKEITGKRVFALSFPNGYHNDLVRAILNEEQIPVTLSIDNKINTVIKGLPQSLTALGRINVVGGKSGADLIEMIDSLRR